MTASVICCKSCGSTCLHEKHGEWGPHKIRVTCEDCGKFVRWGAVHRQVRRVEILPESTVGDVLKAIDKELKEAGDRLGLHWGFYSEPYRKSDPIAERYAKPWPETVVVVVRGGDNEGWMVELWDWHGVGAERGPKTRVAMAKIIDSREHAFEFAKLASIASGVL